jgi:cephalosporin hydroxylase
VKYIVDDQAGTIVDENGQHLDLYSPTGFAILSDIWLKVSWDQKHLYSFTWLGRPIIQHPEDLVRIQEVIYQQSPDVIIETGIAHGGSLVLSASICKAMNKGRVIGVDIEIRPHNRTAIESHPLSSLISMYEGSSIDESLVADIKSSLNPNDRCLVILDSCHDYAHVYRELELYGPMVAIDSYIVATDGSQEYLNVSPRAKVDYPACAEWPHNNPKRAAEDFVKNYPNFIIEEPAFLFNEGAIDFRITHWPSAFIRRIA